MSPLDRPLLRLAVPLVLLELPIAAQQIPYPVTPDWVSADTDVGTGCALADLDRDGWPDLIVANGNDIVRQRLVIYRNQGDGTFPALPTWSSSDLDYHGHVSVGDVNGDGWLDVAVAVFLGPAGFSEEGHAKLYLNDGAGNLEGTPSWTSQDAFYSFSVALGDADADGDLDLAVATGEPYYHAPDVNRVFLNQGGVLDGLPAWTSSESDHTLDIAWGDVDGDGWLDLVSCNAQAPARVHYGGPGGLSTTAGWTASAPTSPFGNTIHLGDVDLDGTLDLALSDNDQLTGGTGRFYLYLGTGAGLDPAPAWQSPVVGMVSAVVLCDGDGDGWKDLVCGSWWGALRVYRNLGGTFGSSPAYLSATTSVIEALPVADVDRSVLVAELAETHAGNGTRRVYSLARTPVASIEAVRVDGAPLPASQYCHDPETGWISLASAPTSELSVDYTWTRSPDVAVSNWDGGIGNYVFRRRDVLATAYCFGDGSGTACPCGNASAPGAGQGCTNSSAQGGGLAPGGTSSASYDDLLFEASGLLPGQPALLFGAQNAVNGGQGIVFGDGLRCAGGGVVRLGVRTPDALGRAGWGPGLGAQGGWSAGDLRRFQVWYRDPAGPCSSTFNLTHGVEVSFLP